MYIMMFVTFCILSYRPRLKKLIGNYKMLEERFPKKELQLHLLLSLMAML
jgi:hypothetical protein